MFGNARRVPRRPDQMTLDDMGTPLSDVTFCVIDFETTGGSAEHDRITEIGAVKYRAGECLGTFQTLVNPGVAIPPYITILTGITEAMVMPAPRIESLLGTLTHFIGDSVIVAHNARFDVGFLNAELGFVGHPSIPPERVVDTLHIARQKHPGSGNSLDALCRRYGIDNSKRTKHGALLDKKAATVVAARVDLQRPAPLPSRLSDEERQAHVAFVEGLGEHALWKQALN